ncbi:MAG: GGDEF domain-containing phosphodiesterase, partial [Pseudomonadota bacterium]
KIGVSIGLAQYPQHGETIARLTDRADTALYASKDQGRGIYTLFEHSLEGERQLEQHVQNKLRDAIANGDIKMHYQPIFNPGSGRVNSVEALARWTDDALGVIAPSTFIKVAESSGHIFELSGHILNTVCEDMKRMPGVRVAVNISAQQFGRADFVQTVADLLKRHKVPVGMLMLEITETSLLKDMDRAKATLEALRGLGVHVALDDFGVGYSSMGYLRQLSLSRLKIDISFVRELTTDDRSIPIISAMVAVGKSLGIQIVAEGVETVEQRKILERIGCDYLQGYLFAEPAPLDDMQTLLKAQGAPSQKPLKRA